MDPDVHRLVIGYPAAESSFDPAPPTVPIGETAAMILIGTMNLTRTCDRGNFYCPTCGTTETYRLRARRPFLTLYFIPTVPIGGPETFVQCDHCRECWDETVLQMDRESHEAAKREQFQDEAIRASILMVLVNQDISEDQIVALQRIASDLLERPLDREELGRLCSIAVQNRIEAKNYVLTVSHRWTEEQKRLGLQAMFLAVTAVDEPGEAQYQLLADLRDLLDLTSDEYEEAIEEVLHFD